MLDLWQTLETERTVLRKMTNQDLDFICKHFSDEDVCRFLVDAEPVSSAAEAQDIIDWCNNYGNPSSRQNRWMIDLKDTGSPIGTIGFHNWDKTNHIVELGYDLSKEYWGKGIMTEVMHKVLTFVFREMHVNRVQAFVHLENASSYHVLKKQGFVAEGIIRDRHFFRGKYYDHHILGLLKQDFQQVPTSS